MAIWGAVGEQAWHLVGRVPPRDRWGQAIEGTACQLHSLASQRQVLVWVEAEMVVRMMTTCQIPLPARPRYPHRGIFWWIKAEPDTPELGHGGAGHSVLVVMPALDIVAVMLRNRLGNPPGFIYYDRDYPVFMEP